MVFLGKTKKIDPKKNQKEQNLGPPPETTKRASAARRRRQHQASPRMQLAQHPIKVRFGNLQVGG